MQGTSIDKSLLRRFRPEHPGRVREFRAATAALKWDPQNVLASMATLFHATDTLAEAEVEYYFRRRGTRAWISGASRFLAWVLGSIGLLLPLLAGALAGDSVRLAQFGYVFLAGAAASLAFNSLFGGTSGHVRFVATQLDLERLITQARIDWCAFLAEADPGRESVKRGFAIIHAYASALHARTLSETGQWSETSLAALAKYESALQAREPPKTS